jgi:hypothetical protein
MDDEISQVAEQRFEVGDSVVVLAFSRNGIVTDKSLTDPLRYEVRVEGGAYMRDLEARDLLGTCDEANRTLQV